MSTWSWSESKWMIMIYAVVTIKFAFTTYSTFVYTCILCIAGVLRVKNLAICSHIIYYQIWRNFRRRKEFHNIAIDNLWCICSKHFITTPLISEKRQNPACHTGFFIFTDAIYYSRMRTHVIIINENRGHLYIINSIKVYAAN